MRRLLPGMTLPKRRVVPVAVPVVRRQADEVAEQMLRIGARFGAPRLVATGRVCTVLATHARLRWQAGCVTIEYPPFGTGVDYRRRFGVRDVRFAVPVLGDLSYGAAGVAGRLVLRRCGTVVTTMPEPAMGGSVEFVEPGGCPPVRVLVRRTPTGYVHRVDY